MSTTNTIKRWNAAGQSSLFADDLAGQNYATEIGYTFTSDPVVPPVVVKTKLTRQAFKNRFPKLANGVTTKYSAAVEMFMYNDAYAASLAVPVSGAALLALRLLIAEGKTSMELSGYVDLVLPDAANFTGLLAQPSIPVEFRLTPAERTAILTAPIQPGEEYKGV